MTRAKSGVIVLVAAVAAVCLGAGTPGTGRGRAGVAAIAAPRHDLKLGFTLAGRIAEVLVEPGVVVQAGQALLRLDDRASKSELETLRLRAESDLEVQAKEAEWRLAQNEEARVRDAHAKAAAAAFELERASLSAKVAELAFRRAKEQRDEARSQYERARVGFEQFTLSAPIAGRVEQVMVSAGELVDASRPILRLVVTDPLRLDVPAPMADTLSLNAGAPAWISFALRPGQPAVEGKVVFVAAVGDGASGTRLVRVEVANPGGVPAGSDASVSFERPAAGE